MTTFDEIIKLYYKFDKYKKFTYPELYYHILPSINNNQVVINYGYMILLYLKMQKKLWHGFIIILKII